jgi:putative DNA primase/helicase
VSAAALAAALGDAQREGSAWRCRCPLHGGRSLLLRDGAAGCLLVTCWGGCDRRDVLVELHRRGLLGGRAGYASDIVPVRRRDDDERMAWARGIWRGAGDGDGTVAARYLATRGIELEHWPATLRFHPRCPRPKDGAGNLVSPLAAMVALVEHAERGPVAVHCTYLRPDGGGKALVEKPRAIFGPVGGGAVRFGMPRAGEWLAVAEGIETALSVAAACAMPAWAALSAGGIKTLALPAEATHVVICADRDASGTGERAAHDAAARWLAEARLVRVAMPPEPGADFNDILLGRSPAKINGVPHGA